MSNASHRKQRRGLAKILILVLALAGIVLFYLLGRLVGQWLANREPGTVSSDPTPTAPTTATTAEPTTTPTTEPSRTFVDGHYIQEGDPEWYLILVNQWNWLDADYYQTLTNQYIAEYSTYGSMDSRVHQALHEMLEAGSEYGLYGAYLFRTVERSNNNWSRRVQQYLDQGYSQQEAELKAQSIQARGYTSEHNAGLAADLECPGYTGLNEDFDQSPAFAWLQQNCWKYGFILRYPREKQDITGVIYEPWHYRYVGVEAATEIMEQGICLEEYLAP